MSGGLFKGKGGGYIPLPSTVFPTSTEPTVSGRQIQIYGMFQGVRSLSQVSSAITRELAAHFSVAISSYNGSEYADEKLKSLSGFDKSAKVGIYHGIPEALQIPLSLYRHKIKIGGFVCETNSISKDWVTVCNHFDLIYVPSNFCRRAFLQSGVTTKVLVVPHGLDQEIRPVSDISRSTHRPIIFFNTFDANSSLDRKSAKELIRCFCQTFSCSDNALLHIRTQKTSSIKTLCQKYDKNNQVRLIPFENLSLAKYAELYSRIHCVVHPSKSEGFGLIPFHAIACERPVIAPAVTGMVDYLDKGNAMLLKTISNDDKYDRIDEEHLCELLRYMYENWETRYAISKSVGPKLREKFRWSSSLAKLTSFVSSTLGS